MTTTTANPPPCTEPAQVRGQHVSREEIAHIERILQMIDLKNAVLANASKYLVAWQLIQELDARLTIESSQLRDAVSEAFIGLLDIAERRGNGLLQSINCLGIESQQMILAADCDSESFAACVKLISDKLRQWRGIDLEETVISRIWVKALNESECALS